MKTRGIAHILIGSLLCVILIMPSTVQAGSAARHRWEGALIGLGVGAFMAGAAMVPPPVVVAPVPVPVRSPFLEPAWIPGFPPPPPFPPRDRDWERDRHRGRHGDWDRHRHDRRHGHWETRRVWVQPVFESSYREGRYNRWGEWVPGHWERTMVRPGFWREEREWVHR